MARVKFSEGGQGRFLRKIKEKSKSEWLDMAKSCGIDRRTLFGWRQNKYNMTYDALLIIKKLYGVSFPRQAKVAPEYWNARVAGRLGAIKRNELYGNLGTPEGRRRGGLSTWRRYELDPKRFERTGFVGRKDIGFPAKSAALAELIGIILGDGSITQYQITISLNNKTERPYADFVSGLFKKLFKVKVALKVRKKNTCDLVVSSIKLTNYLVKIGLKRGDKIRQQVAIPKWILKNKNYTSACVRGLIDTDGGVYYHNHVTKGIRYKHLGLCFTSYSSPLLKDVHNVLLRLGFPAKINLRGHVYIYDREAIKEYFLNVGTHNPHILRRYRDYFK